MPKRSTTVAELREHFGAEGFTVAQANEVGVSVDQLNDACRLGRIRRVARGRYVLASAQDPLDRYLDLLRGVIAGRPGLVLAGVSAAAAWGLPCPDTWADWTTLPITVASAKRVNLPQGATRFRLGARTSTTRVGLPVTDLVPTAIDVAWQLPEPQALIVVDAIALRLVGRDDRRSRAAARDQVRGQLLSALEGQNRRPGLARVSRTLSWCDPSADSPPESYLRGHLLAAGMPAPEVNARVVGVSGRGYYADLYWPRGPLIVEIDGKIKYREEGALPKEKAREDDLRAAGYGFKRIEAKDVFAHAPLLVDEVRGRLGVPRAA